MKYLSNILLLALFFHITLILRGEYKSSSVLSSGNWIKVSTSERGIHKITFTQLREMGITNPDNVTVFGNGGEVLPKNNSEHYPDDLNQLSTWIRADESGEKSVYFFATGMVKIIYNDLEQAFQHTMNEYSEEAFYFITSDFHTPNRAENQEPINEIPDYYSSSYSRYQFVDNEEVNLIQSGRKWYDYPISGGATRNYSFNFPHLITSEPVKVKISTVARAGSATSLQVSAGSENQHTINYRRVSLTTADGLFAREANGSWQINASADRFVVNLNYLASSNDKCWVDYISIEARCELSTDTSPLEFSDPRAIGSSVSEYSFRHFSENFIVWNTTRPESVYSLLINTENEHRKIKDRSSTLQRYVAFDPDGDLPTVKLVGEIENQDLHSSQSNEMIIVTPKEFLLQAKELAAFHQKHDGLSVAVLNSDDIFNEFGSGMADASAIRNLMRMYAKQSGNTLKYLLLFGDGSYDNRDLRKSNRILLPTYQSASSNSYSRSFVSDDYFGLLDDDEGEFTGTLNIGIGRLTISSIEEAKMIVEKIKHYTSSKTVGSWRNRVCLIADDGDNGLHLNQSEALSEVIKSEAAEYYQSKIYFDSHKQENTPAGQRYPSVNTAINEEVKNGTLILNYVGHANDHFLANEQVLGRSDIEGWTNYNNLPIFVTATCEFSRFDADEQSSGEAILTTHMGGGIGLFSTTRLVNAYENALLNQNLFRYIFDQNDDGSNLRMGDVMRLAKNATNSNSNRNKRNFTLLADPALSLSFPNLRIKVTSVNQTPILANQSIEVGALDQVTVEGEVINHAGEVVNDFDGKLIPTVFDKAFLQQSLGNDASESPITYSEQSNILFRGNSSIISGRFSFSFVIPKDISYQKGRGLISFYASDDTGRDANGAFEDIFIGGTSSNEVNDNQGPEIDIFLNDTTFASGDRVGANSVLYLKIRDENGINILGTGIGHDIVAIIDDETNDPIVLNSHYKSDLDSYQKGEVRYLLPKLSQGRHKISVKAWDIAGNSTVQEVEFEVGDRFYISQFYCAPNPMRDEATLFFRHNDYGSIIKGRLKILSLQGQVLFQKSFNHSADLENINRISLSRSELISITKGIYICHLELDNGDGHSTYKAARIIIL